MRLSMPQVTHSIAHVDAFVVVGDRITSPAPACTRRRGWQRLAESATCVCAYPRRPRAAWSGSPRTTGTVGWGETHAPLGPRATKAVVEDVLAPLLLGGDPLAIEHHWARMYGSMRLRGHVAGFQLEAIAGVDIALWDLAGKLLDVPVYRLLGGPFRTELPVYASGVPGRTVQERVASAEQFVAQGYTAVKASIGRGDIDADLAGSKRSRGRCADVPDLLVDARRLLRRQRVVRRPRAQDMGVYWLEDPLPPEDIDGYVHLAAARST
jgi:L-alanine-DL-glutamate epimerase-like enolase superfamily enzyme